MNILEHFGILLGRNILRGRVKSAFNCNCRSSGRQSKAATRTHGLNKVSACRRDAHFAIFCFLEHSELRMRREWIEESEWLGEWVAPCHFKGITALQTLSRNLGEGEIRGIYSRWRWLWRWRGIVVGWQKANPSTNWWRLGATSKLPAPGGARADSGTPTSSRLPASRSDSHSSSHRHSAGQPSSLSVNNLDIIWKRCYVPHAMRLPRHKRRLRNGHMSKLCIIWAFSAGGGGQLVVSVTSVEEWQPGAQGGAERQSHR